MLSGTIVVTGLVGWLRFLPAGEWSLPAWGAAFVALGLATALYGAIVGVDQRRPKVVLAYSTVSQLGIMTVGIGTILMEPALATISSTAVALFALHHGLAKSALFLGAGLATTGMDSARRRWLVTGLALPSLALAGAPFTSGMVAKSAIVAGEATLPGPWADVLLFVLPATSVATALLMARFLFLIHNTPATTKPPAATMPWLIWAASTLLVLILPLWLAPAADFSLSVPKLFESLWPLGVALLVALAAIRVWRLSGRPDVPEIPAGDMLMPLEHLISTVRRGASSFGARLGERRKRLLAAAADGRRSAWTLIQKTSETETFLNRWPVAMILALLVGFTLAWLAAAL